MVSLSNERVAFDLKMYLMLMIRARKMPNKSFESLYDDICDELNIKGTDTGFDEMINVCHTINLTNVLGLLKDLYIDTFDSSDEISHELDFVSSCLRGTENDNNYWNSHRVQFIRQVRNAICHSDEIINEDGSIDIHCVPYNGIPLNVHLEQKNLFNVCNFLANNSKRNRVYRMCFASTNNDVDLGDYVNADKATLINVLKGIEFVRLQSNISSTRQDIIDKGIKLDREHPDDFIDSYLETTNPRQEYRFFLTDEQCEDIANQIIDFKNSSNEISAKTMANILVMSNLEFGDMKQERLFYEALKLRFISGENTYNELYSFLREDYIKFVRGDEHSEFYSRLLKKCNFEPKHHFVMLYEDSKYPFNELSNYLNYVFSHFGYPGEYSNKHRNSFMHGRFAYLKTISYTEDGLDPYILMYDNSDDVNRPKSLSGVVKSSWCDCHSCSELISMAEQTILACSGQQVSSGQK